MYAQAQSQVFRRTGRDFVKDANTEQGTARISTHGMCFTDVDNKIYNCFNQRIDVMIMKINL